MAAEQQADIRTLDQIPGYWAARQRDAVAMRFGDRDTTYAELDAASNRIANALIADGLKPGDRIALLARNTDLFFTLLFGAIKAGVVLVPVNFRLAPPEVAFVVADAEARMLFVDEVHAGLVETIEADLAGVRRIIDLDGVRPRWTAYAAWCAAAPARDPAIGAKRDWVAIQMYTSGTTGHPKGVQLSHHNLLINLERAVVEWDDWRTGDVNLVCMPLYHIAGSAWGLVGLYAGCRNIILADVDPPEILRLIARERVTKVLFVPAVILFLLQTPACAETDFSSLELVIYGASPIPANLLRRAVETFGCRFAQVYGLTETTGAITYLDPEDHDPKGSDRMASCGKAMSGVEIRIVDQAGHEVATGEVGEIICRSAQVMPGYWNLPEVNAKAIRDGWFHSGDVGYLDQDGYLYIHDRIKDMIISGGENIYPAEVESALFEHGDVADVAVIGVPDEKWGEAVKAVVVPRDGADLSDQDLILFARQRIAGYKVPRSVDFVATLPRNPSGKILKRELRAPYWRDQERGVH